MIAILLAGCRPAPAVPEVAARVVETTRVGLPGAERLPLPGRVRAKLASTLAFELGGVVERVLVDEGDVVQAGDVLANLERRSLRLTRSARAAELSSARASLADAERTYARMAELVTSGAVSEAEFDGAVARRDVARSRAEMARSALALAGEQLRDGALRAPFSGRIGQRRIEPGQSVAPGMPAFYLVGEGTREVVVNVPESLLGRIDQGRDHTVELAATPVRLSARFAGAASEASEDGTYVVRFDLRATSADVPSGSTARIELTLVDPAPGVAIPATAYARDEQGEAYVYLLEGQRVARRPVRLADGAEARVVAGLQGGETIVRRGLPFLRPGDAVRVFEGPVVSAVGR